VGGSEEGNESASSASRKAGQKAEDKCGGQKTDVGSDEETVGGVPGEEDVLKK
jgi:hypothetical protein